MKLFIFILFLVGCGHDNSLIRIDNTSPNELLSNGDFDPYIQMFVQEAWHQGVSADVSNIEVSFALLEPPTIGACYMGSGKIEIDPRWRDFKYMERIALMFHELGHCVLGRDHTEEFSIMQPGLLQSDVMLDNEEALMAELFEPQLELHHEHIHSDFCGGSTH